MRYTDPTGHFPFIAISLLVVGGLLFFSTTSDAIHPVPQSSEEQRQEAIQAGLGFTIMTLGLLPPATQVQIGTGIMADGDPTNEISAGIEVADDVAEATTNLYRAVGQNEMSDILQNNIIRPNPNSLSMWDKWFWQSYESATKWVELTKKAGYDYVGIVEVEVQAAILELGRQVPNQDTCGPAVVFAMEVLDDFNNAIIGIVEHTIQ